MRWRFPTHNVAEEEVDDDGDEHGNDGKHRGKDGDDVDGQDVQVQNDVSAVQLDCDFPGGWLVKKRVGNGQRADEKSGSKAPWRMFWEFNPFHPDW